MLSVTFNTFVYSDIMMYVALHSEVTWSMVVWCTRNSCGTSHASAVSFGGYSKPRYKKVVHSCKRSESVRERRIALQ